MKKTTSSRQLGSASESRLTCNCDCGWTGSLPVRIAVGCCVDDTDCCRAETAVAGRCPFPPDIIRPCAKKARRDWRHPDGCRALGRRSPYPLRERDTADVQSADSLRCGANRDPLSVLLGNPSWLESATQITYHRTPRQWDSIFGCYCRLADPWRERPRSIAKRRSGPIQSTAPARSRDTGAVAAQAEPGER